MSSKSATTATRPRGRPPKPMPGIESGPEEVARAMLSAVKPPDPSIRAQKSYTRKSKPLRALTTYPQAQQQQEGRFNGILAA